METSMGWSRFVLHFHFLSLHLSLSRKKQSSLLFNHSLCSPSSCPAQLIHGTPNFSTLSNSIYCIYLFIFVFLCSLCHWGFDWFFFFCVFENYPFFVFLLCWWVFSYFPESCFLCVKVFCLLHRQALCLELGCEVYVLLLLFWFAVLGCLFFIFLLFQ